MLPSQVDTKKKNGSSLNGCNLSAVKKNISLQFTGNSWFFFTQSQNPVTLKLRIMTSKETPISFLSEQKICYSKSNANWLQPFKLSKLRDRGGHTDLQGEVANHMQLEPNLNVFLSSRFTSICVCVCTFLKVCSSVHWKFRWKSRRGRLDQGMRTPLYCFQALPWCIV